MTGPAVHRAEDARLTDIQESVHHINDSIHHIETRLDRSDERITSVERQVMQNTANQNALELVMNAEHRRLSDKVDLLHGSMSRVDDTLKGFTERETQNARKILFVVLTTLLSVLGCIGYLMLTNMINGGLH